MPDKIRLLPDTVASQIAAGEVVNRPASVVKEMMENSVDAGATAITVSYRNGGKELIKVIDDGEGMSPLDARMAFDKHATSKITRIEDVYALHTFGFRGEALASIAAIAHVELTTRRPEDELGTQLVVEGSRFQSQENVVAPVGSQFAVKNLFFNVPARRRALDKSTTEPRHIAEEFRRVAMCHPEMSFSLYGEDAPVYTLHPSGLKQRIVGLVGKHAAGNLLEVEIVCGMHQVPGWQQTIRPQHLVRWVQPHAEQGHGRRHLSELALRGGPPVPCACRQQEQAGDSDHAQPPARRGKPLPTRNAEQADDDEQKTHHGPCATMCFHGAVKHG